MNSKLILGCGAAVVAVVMGCGSSSGSGGSGGKGSTSSVSATSSTHAATATSSHTVTGSATTGTAATGGAGGAPPMACNPIKDTQCDVAGGFACDDNQDGTFGCYNMPANTVALCGACDYKNGNACQDGMTCVTADALGTTNKCARFCCSDADCGPTAGGCDLTATSANGVGLCGSVSGLGGAGGGGTGGAGPFFVPICTGIPATPPSNGTCFTP